MIFKKDYKSLTFPTGLLVAFVGLSLPSQVSQLYLVSAVCFAGMGILLPVFVAYTFAHEGEESYRRDILVLVSFQIPFSFTCIFVAIQWVYPKCLEASATVHDTLYFSYVTYTSLGYGDLTPYGICRDIAVIEALSGLIAIGLVVSAFNRKREK